MNGYAVKVAVRAAAVVLAIVMPVLAVAQPATSAKPEAATETAVAPPPSASAPAFTIAPVLIQSKESSKGANLGLEYGINYVRKWEFAVGDSSAGKDNITPKDLKRFKPYAIFVRALGSGTVTADSDDTPNKMLDLSLSSGGELSTLWAGYFRLGAAAKVEVGQGGGGRQFFYGLTSQWTKTQLIMNGGTGTVMVNYGRIDPGKDDERKKLLGNLDAFKRWDIEATYSMRLTNPNETEKSNSLLRPRYLSFAYRHFQETGAPQAIKTAGKERNRLGSIRLGLADGLFVQYSRGSLPFDKKSDRAVTLGWTMALTAE